MQTIYLTDRNRPITITDSAYEHIVVLVQANRICASCQQPFRVENPCVAPNRCLACFLLREGKKALTFIGQAPDSEEWYQAYQFLDTKGYIWLSYAYRDEVERSSYHTARHWGFPVPQTYTQKGKEWQLSAASWSLYGDFQTQPVIVLLYSEQYRGKLTVAFLSFKHGQTLALDKRRREVQKLFSAARVWAEARKESHGNYHVGKQADESEEQTVSQLSDSHLYPLIADIVSAQQRQAGWG